MSSRQPGPKYPIARVRELASEGTYRVEGSENQHFVSPKEARDFAKARLCALENAQFAKCERLTNDWADVYGLSVDGCGWYLKLIVFEEDDPRVLVVSLHPLEHRLNTRGGVVEP